MSKDLVCLSCGQPLTIEIHHTQADRDEGHKPLPYAVDDRYMRQAIDVPVQSHGGALTSVPPTTSRHSFTYLLARTHAKGYTR